MKRKQASLVLNVEKLVTCFDVVVEGFKGLGPPPYLSKIGSPSGKLIGQKFFPFSRKDVLENNV